MELNFLERQALRLALGRMEKRMPGLKAGLVRWAPFLATAVAVLTVALRHFGYEGVADGIASVLPFLGVDISGDTVLAGAAVTSVAGLVNQAVSRYRKARASA